MISEGETRRTRCSPYTCRRWTSYFAMGCFFLAGGVEYSVILPTMFDYVTKVNGGEEWLYGLTLAAFSISNLVTGPLYGIVFDKTHATKFIVLFANLFEIGGNIMYFAATSKYMILGSRFIVGLGAGAGAAIFGELARTTTKKQRTTVFSIFMAMRQIGLVFGPAFNLFLRISNFDLGPFKVDRFTSPGLFMAVVWILIELMFIFLFYQLPLINEEDETVSKRSEQPKASVQAEASVSISHQDEQRNNARSQQITSSTKDMFLYSHSVSGDVSPYNSTLETIDENTPLIITNRIAVNQDPDSTYGITDSETILATGLHSAAASSVHVSNNAEDGCHNVQKKTGNRYIKRFVWLVSEFLREEIVVLLAILFVTMFDQTAIEAMLVPMAESLLKWTEQDISIFYSAAGIEILLSFVIVILLSKVIGDRWQIAIGVTFEVVGYSWLLGLIGNATPDTPWVLWRFILGGAVCIFGLPLFVVTSASLYSKFLPPHIQGFGQGIRRSVFSLAAILGPIWAGGTVAFGTYYILLGVPCGLLVFVLVLLLLSFTRLKEPASVQVKPKS